MKGTLFTSSKNTLIFAAAIIVGALMLVGGEDTPASVAGTTDEFVAEPEVIDPIEEESEEPAEAADNEEYDDFDGEEDVEYAEGEDLIDAAEGFDPADDIAEFQPEADID